MGGDNGLLPFICRLDSLKSTPPAWAGTILVREHAHGVVA